MELPNLSVSVSGILDISHEEMPQPVGDQLIVKLWDHVFFQPAVYPCLNIYYHASEFIEDAKRNGNPFTEDEAKLLKYICDLATRNRCSYFRFERPDESDPVFPRMLDLSTGHLREETRNYMEERGKLPFRYQPTEHGYIFWPTEDAIHEDEEWEVAPELRAINKYAYESGCMVVNFDTDADEDDRFPMYE